MGEGGGAWLQGGGAAVAVLAALLTTGMLTHVLFWLAVHVTVFLASVLGMLYYQGWRRSILWRAALPLPMPAPSPGLSKLILEMRSGKKAGQSGDGASVTDPRGTDPSGINPGGADGVGADRRMTGSFLIDDELHELLSLAWHDYLQTWHRKLSDDQEFEREARATLQQLIVAFSDRVKTVDVGDYLFKKLVDDVASHIRLHRRALDRMALHRLDSTKPPPDLERLFFELECEMEGLMCRDSVCLDPQAEKQYLRELAETLLYVLLPAQDFHDKHTRYIVREVLVQILLLPCINMLSDPDYVNQTISWLTRAEMLSSESLLVTLRTSDCVDELVATRAQVDRDIARQRARDTGGSDDAEIKQQLSSLKYVRAVCEASLERLQQQPDTLDLMVEAGGSLPRLPWDYVLSNNVALEFFLTFMSGLGARHLVHFYFTVEGYRVTAEQQISAALLTESEEGADLEMLREACASIYQQYLSEKASPPVKCEDKLLKKIQYSIKYREPSEAVFDQIQAQVFHTMREDPRYYPAFLRSQLYLRLLATLQPSDVINASRDTPVQTAAEASQGGLRRTSEEAPRASAPELSRVKGHAKSHSIGGCAGLGVGERGAVPASASCEDLASLSGAQSTTAAAGAGEEGRGGRRGEAGALTAHITNTGICREHGREYAVYLVSVRRGCGGGATAGHMQREEAWSVYRRYSDFNDLHAKIQSKFPDMAAVLVLPSKKVFNNVTPALIERRRHGLNAYLQTVLNPGVLSCYRGLLDLVTAFLAPPSAPAKKSGSGGCEFRGGVAEGGGAAMLGSALDSLAEGVSRGLALPRAVLGRLLPAQPATAAPSAQEPGYNAAKGGLGAGSEAVIEHLNPADNSKVLASVNTELEEVDNLALRLLLLLLDEVFTELRQAWLRRRVTAVLRGLVQALLGDSINKRLLEHVAKLTHPTSVAGYIRHVREQLWPGGVLAEPRPPRDHDTRMRTRVVAKAKMLGTIDDELKSFLGSDTTRRGVTRLFSMFQRRALNKRLVYCVLEGALCQLLPDHNLPAVFQALHAASPTTRQAASHTARQPSA